MIKKLKYLGFSVLILISLGNLGFLANFLRKISLASGRSLLTSCFLILLYICLGFILGLQLFNTNKIKSGAWKVDFYKMGFLGVPLLFISAFNYIYYFIPVRLIMHMTSHLQPFFMNGTIQIIAQISLGYVIITSFYKD